MPADVDSAVASVLDGARTPALVVSDLELTGVPDDVTVIAVADDKPDGHFRTVVLVATDVADLRRQVPRLGTIGWARWVGVVLADADRVLLHRPDPSTAALAAVDAEPGWTRLEHTDRVEATPVLRALARAAGWPVVAGQQGLRVARAGDAFDDPATKHPPDVVVDPPSPPVTAEPTGRAPVVVSSAALPLALDEAVFNPIGFRFDATGPVVDLPASTRLTAALVRDLRDALGVRPAPGSDPSLVAGLAMSGIPLVTPDDDVAEPRRREELSVRQRRAALLDHASFAARARLAATAGVRVVTPSLGVAPSAHRATPSLSAITASLDLVPDTLAVTTDSSPDLVVVVAGNHAWGPDVVTDLLLARRYSGADVVVMSRHGVGPTEAYLDVDDPGGWAVALLGRTLHHDLGVDHVVRAGGTAYRTHGLGVGA